MEPYEKNQNWSPMFNTKPIIISESIDFIWQLTLPYHIATLMSRVSSVRAKKCSLLSAHQCRHCMQRISKERSKDQDTDVSLYTKGLYYYSRWGPFIYNVTTPWHLFLTSSAPSLSYNWLRSHEVCTIYIKIHAILSVRLSVCPSVLFFNPLPMNQFESQIYLWISLNMAEILRPF